MSENPLRVCYFGTYRAEYSRNKIMIEALRRAGVEVIECHEPLWRSIEDRVQMASGGWQKPEFWLRVVGAYARLIERYPKLPDHDVLIVGYPGQFDVYLARLLSSLRGKPLVWDVFMSIYLVALERKLDERSAFTVEWLRRIERTALRLPDLLVHDTREYAAWLAKTHDLDVGQFHLVPTGADERVYRPATEPRAPGGRFEVLYYGSFIPNHGVRTIIEAARHLQGERRIHFQLIGDGPERPLAEALAREARLENVTFSDWLEPHALVERAAKVDVCLGAFGTTPQSLMTVQNKIYEGLAMALPVITGHAEEISRSLRHKEHLYLCPRQDGKALADAILDLFEHPALRKQLAEQGHQIFMQQYSLEQLGKRYRAHLEQALRSKEGT